MASAGRQSRCRGPCDPGDDADATGAVCGQLAGAYWGESGIPIEWRKGLARPEMIEQPVQKLVRRRKMTNTLLTFRLTMYVPESG